MEIIPQTALIRSQQNNKDIITHQNHYGFYNSHSSFIEFRPDLKIDKNTFPLEFHWRMVDSYYFSILLRSLFDQYNFLKREKLQPKKLFSLMFNR